MPPQNRAAWLPEKQSPIQPVKEAPYNTPLANELVIQNMAIALNPADVLIQKLGILADTYPTILGCDAAGIVVEIGSNITEFKIGDRVLGTTQPRPGGVNKYAGFQLYPVLKMPRVAKIPDDARFEDAAVLPLGIFASSACLFHETTLGLEMPPSEAGKGKTLLVWGASSSIGSCGVQLATAAGYEVFGIASEKNHGYVKSLGASQTFDQNDSNLVEKVVAALKGKTCVGAYDAISKDETIGPLCDILRQSEGRKFIAAVAPSSESKAKYDVVVKTNFGATDYDTSIGPQIWRTFLEPALAAGTFQYKPTADVVGHGLEDVQKACDLLAKGVSAKKVVVSLE